MSKDRSKDAFFAVHGGPVLVAELPGPRHPRGFSTKESTARTRELAPEQVGLPHPESTVIYVVEKSDRNNDPRIVCGRGLTADVIINHDSISKHHASFDRRGDAWSLCDLGSKNGTVLRGVALAANEAHPLGDEAELVLGECAFTFFAPGALWELLARYRGATHG
jgi:hypothetical protein